MLKDLLAETLPLANEHTKIQKLQLRYANGSQTNVATVNGNFYSKTETSHQNQTLHQNCFSVTPALMMPVDEVPAEMTLPISSTISEPLHFWCVKVSTPCFLSSRWINCT